MTSSSEVLPRKYEVWCPDDELIARRDRFILGDTLTIAVDPTARDVLQSLAQIRSDTACAYWTATADKGGSTTAHLTGLVSRLRTVTSPFVLRAGGWVPAMQQAQTSLAGSSLVHPGRSVWPPSGAPVLLGFLVTFTNARVVAAHPAAA